jgi:hypothetical protein
MMSAWWQPCDLTSFFHVPPGFDRRKLVALIVLGPFSIDGP